MSFRRAPDAAMDAPHLMLPWARLALAAAVRAQAKKASAKTKMAAKKKSSRSPVKKRLAKLRSLGGLELFLVSAVVAKAKDKTLLFLRPR